MDFLMSGDDEVLDAITTLAVHGYRGVQRKTDATSHWLSVSEDEAPENAAAITQIVFRIDPGAVQV
jgi:hypothetical protein